MVVRKASTMCDSANIMLNPRIHHRKVNLEVRNRGFLEDWNVQPL